MGMTYSNAFDYVVSETVSKTVARRERLQFPHRDSTQLCLMKEHGSLGYVRCCIFSLGEFCHHVAQRHVAQLALDRLHHLLGQPRVQATQ